MYAAVRTYHHVGDIDSVSRRVREEFVPIVRTVPGFVGYYLIDAGGQTFSVTLCEDKAGVDETTARAAEWAKESLAGLIEGIPEIAEGDVTVEESRLPTFT